LNNNNKSEDGELYGRAGQWSRISGDGGVRAFAVELAAKTHLRLFLRIQAFSVLRYALVVPNHSY
jgi:hypothetical protein